MLREIPASQAAQTVGCWQNQMNIRHSGFLIMTMIPIITKYERNASTFKSIYEVVKRGKVWE
ncbi:MAG: hypothetical protein ACLTEE_02250 [Anaerobutyricum hallii]